MPAVDVESLIVEDRDAGHFKVHRSTMTSQEIFELERAQIFDKCWLYVGHESEVSKPGDFKRRNVGGRPIIFIHGIDGEIRALLQRVHSPRGEDLPSGLGQLAGLPVLLPRLDF